VSPEVSAGHRCHGRLSPNNLEWVYRSNKRLRRARRRTALFGRHEVYADEAGHSHCRGK
jgi:hypothetical protein